MGQLLDRNKPLIVKKRGGGERIIPYDKWFINRNTPVGEEADVYERKPYGGKKYIPWDKIIGTKND